MPESSLVIQRADSVEELPKGIDIPLLVDFLHDQMKPYEDTHEDIRKALDYVFSTEPGKGGFLVLGTVDGELVGIVVMLDTAMEGYIPPHLLLFIAVHQGKRGAGIGGQLMKRVIAECPGEIKLHVEYENPAKRLYERVGFTSKYAEMRFKP